MSMNNYFQQSEQTDDDQPSPSNVIDLMISTVIFDYSAMKNAITSDEQPCFSHRTFYNGSLIRRKRPTAIRNHFSTIDSLTRSAWNHTSSKQLERAERKIFETLKSKFDGRYVSVSNNTQQIWTVYSNLTSTNIPIVLIHGFGGGLALWSLNLDQLSADRPVYAIDLPGFARSSRPRFSLDPVEAEKEFVNMLEDWRIAIGLNKSFILLGHSFGGFLSACYTLNYPKYIEQLVLIDPWGFGQKPDDIWQTGRLQRVPTWLRSFSSVMMKISPLTGLRAAGPLGVPVIKHFRSDLRIKFEKLFSDDRVLVYLYHCNAQLPTGEQAFRTISDCFAWAKKPLVERIHLLDEQIPIYFLHGEQSWISIEPSLITQEKRQNVFIEIIKEAGHHIYADAPTQFDIYLKRILFNKD